MPCSHAWNADGDAGKAAGSGNKYTGQHQATNKIVANLDTASNMKTAVAEYALCYSAEGSANGKWSDSGIRITLAQINNLEYFGTNGETYYCSSSAGPNVANNKCDTNFDGTYGEQCAAPAGDYSLCKPSNANNGGCGDSGACTAVIAARKRTMTTEYKATNKLPQEAGSALVYNGPLDDSAAKYISLVASDLNGNNPCVNSALTSTAAGHLYSGVLTTAIHDTLPASKFRRFVVPQNTTLLNENKVFAVCYATNNGGVGEITWRDSYIRMTVSQVPHITSYKVKHVTTGQLASHPQLKIDYANSLAAGSRISIVRASHASTTIGTASYAIPCADASVAGAAANWTHSGASAAASGSRTVTIDTVDLKPYDGGEVDYAVCYSAPSTGHFVDSGIRVTFPEVVNMQYDSGYSSSSRVCLAFSNDAGTGSKCDADFDGIADDTCALGAACPPADIGLCANTDAGTRQGTFCDVNGDGVFKEPCADGEMCQTGNSGCGTAGGAVCTAYKLNSGCGNAGKCGYQEICTAIGGKEVSTNKCDANWDGVFNQSCVVNAQCDSTNPYNGGCGTHGVCARQGTPVREQTSWVQTDGSTIVETPTNRIPQQVSTPFFAKTHWDAQAHNAVSYKVALVASDAKSTTGNTVINNDNPCVLPFVAARGTNVATKDVDKKTNATTPDGTQDRTAVATVIATGAVDIAQADGVELLKDRIYAVCYSTGNGDNVDATWRDSYVRLKVTRLTSLTTSEVTHLTTGQIPNVVPQDKFRMTYDGFMLASKFISLVDHTLNSGLPCGATATADAVVVGGAATHSGKKQAEAGDKHVSTFDTTRMDTSKTFALCYQEDASGWYDSGIRLTVTKIWNTQFASGHTGPAPLLNANTVDGICRPAVNCSEKADTKVREMTSNTLATNRFPQKAGQQLTYQGTLPASKYVSLVALGTDASPSRYAMTAAEAKNPCVQPFLASRKAGEESTVTGAITANGQKTITVAQGTLLDASKTYAVCYAESRGTYTDHTWRDSYIRLKISQIESLDVMIPLVNVGSSDITDTSWTTIPIRTVGQIPNQIANQQVKYRVDGTIAGHASAHKIFLKDATTNVQRDAASGIENPDPCDVNNVGNIIATNAGTIVTTSNKDVKAYDTSSLDASKLYALCYTTNAGAGTTWSDSGIRITVPKLTGVKYAGLNAANIDDRTRTMTSLHRATHRFPRTASSFDLEYAGSIGNNKWVSLVDHTLNSNNPCVNPAVAAVAADTVHSGAKNAATKKITITQGNALLDATKIYAVCYAETAGSDTDISWRDSYIRLRPSMVEEIESILVTHRTTGQIANHPQLLVKYKGTLDAGKYLSLVDATLGHAALGEKTFPFPCAKRAEAYKVNDAAHSITKQVNGTTVTIGTSNLEASHLLASPALATGNGVAAAGAPRYYAVCYSSGHNNAAAAWEDSGIRVTVPEIIGLQVNSGFGTNRLSPQGLPAFGAGTPADGTLWRDMTSEPLAMNRIAKKAGQKFQYVFSRYSSGCRNAAGGAETVCASGNQRHISLVDASLNNNNPCVLSSITNPASADSTHTDVITPALATSKEFTVDASALDATKTFAVCYSKGQKLWSTTTSDWDDVTPGNAAAIDGTSSRPYWADSYIRLKVSNLESITTLGIEHRTYGQVPDVMPTDKLDFVLSETSGATGAAKVSLVDASLNSVQSAVSQSMQSFPCASTHATTAFDGFHSGAISVDPYKCTKYDATGAANKCKNPATGAFDVACSLGAECKGNDSGCGTAGECKRVVSSFKTHGLATSHGSGTQPGESTQYLGVPVDNVATGTQAHRTNGDITVKGRWFAVCYSGDGTTFEDSGIRVTVSSVYNMRRSSNHIGIPDRDHTSLFLSTNRLPRQGASGAGAQGIANADQALTYHGSLPAQKWISLVDLGMHICRNPDNGVSKCDLTKNGVFDGLCAEGELCDPTATDPCGTGAAACVPVNNPCVNGLTAGAAPDALRSGPKVAGAANKQVTFDLNAVRGHDSDHVAKTFAVCYSNVGGNAASVNWYDSYIRFELSDVGDFGTKKVMHRTYGQLPNHKAKLVYDYVGRLAVGKKIALVDASLNAVAVSGFSQTFTRPCTGSNAGVGAKTTKLSSAITTKAINAQNTKHNGVVNDLDTTGMLTTATFALCFSLGDGSNNAVQATSGWQDSGIRLTISSLEAVIFSGYKKDEAHLRGKLEREISSVLPSLQKVAPATDIFAPVLPKAAAVPLRYKGDLDFSAYISIVEASQNSGNPCVNPTIAAADAGATSVGPARACKSHSEFKHSVCTRIGPDKVGVNCDVNNDGVYDEQCALNARCLHSSADNGGCGINGGTCAGPWITKGTCEHTHHGDSSTHTGNKETTITGAQGLTTHAGNVAKTFAVCYLANSDSYTSAAPETGANLRTSPFDNTGRTVTTTSTKYTTWRDSYIRVTFSLVTSVIATGVTHTDHGTIANHEAASKLNLAFTSPDATNFRFSLVDETLGNGQVKTDRTATAGADDVTAATAYTAAGNTAVTSLELNGVASANEPCSWAAQAKYLPNTADPWLTKKHLDDHTGEQTSANKVVQFVTDGLKTTEQYKLCYSADGTIWQDSGITVQISKLITLRDNILQLPLLTPTGSGTPAVSKFARDLTSSRAKIGRTSCLVIGTGAAGNKVCDKNDDGIFMETCEFGALCDPANPNNGGCGTGLGLCASGVVYKEHTKAGGASAVWKKSLYDTGSSLKGDAATTYKLHHHKLRQTTQFKCTSISAGNTSKCDTNHDGIFQEACTTGALCDPANTDGTNPNAGCGTTGVCEGNLDLEYLGSLGNSKKVSIVDTRLNQGDPCVLATIANVKTHICTQVSQNETNNCDSNNDAVFAEQCVKNAFCHPSNPLNGGCGTTGKCEAATMQVPLRQTGPLTANNAKKFKVNSAIVSNLDSEKTYGVCYEKAAGVWEDSYIRLSISKVEWIRTHQITHRTQGHIARAKALAIQYGGTLAKGKYLALVDDSTAAAVNDAQSVCGGVAAAQIPTIAKHAISGTKTVVFDTTTLDSKKNYAVCYGEDTTALLDSGIRVTVSLLEKLTYNKKNTAGSQQGTVDYFREMDSRNYAPAEGLSDIVPHALNRIPQAANMKFFSTDASTDPLWYALVDTTQNTDFNPCATVCDDSNPCTWSTELGPHGAKTSLRSGPSKADANDVFAVPQDTAPKHLDESKTFAVCYAQKWLNTNDPSSTGTTWASSKYNLYTMRDSYIRLKPSKILKLSSYSVDHFTHGDIPSKAKLTVSFPGSTLTGAARINLVDASQSSFQPCTKGGYQPGMGVNKLDKSLISGDSITQFGRMKNCSGAGTLAGAAAICDVNKDGKYEETCIGGAYSLGKDASGNPVANYGCGAGTLLSM
jgi:hypothetical protein